MNVLEGKEDEGEGGQGLVLIDVVLSCQGKIFL